VLLDVVYNHLGPSGNYLGRFGPYFTDRYRTPWGRAVNYDDAGSDGVREFVVENALMWLRDYHLDGLAWTPCTPSTTSRRCTCWRRSPSGSTRSVRRSADR
jgi:hypothetical protein